MLEPVIESEKIDQIIFLGDYVDDWKCRLQPDLYVKDLNFLHNWVEKYQEIKSLYVMTEGSRELIEATIHLNTDSLKTYDVENGIEVAIHEFGHAVGLGKHSKDKKSIMYYEEGDNQQLTSEDIKRIENLYM